MKAIVALDDDSSDLQWLKRCHAKSGIEHPLVLFQDPAQLTAYLFNEDEAPRPAMVLVDIRMPVSGFDVVRDLLDRGCTTRLILFSTTTHPTDLKRAEDLGVACIQKPREWSDSLDLMRTLAAEIGSDAE